MKRRDLLRAALAVSGEALIGCSSERLPSVPPLSGELPAEPLRANAPQPAPQPAPSVVTADKLRPRIPYGVQSGDITQSRAMIWSRSDRPSRMVVEWSTRESFDSALRVDGSIATPDTDFTAHLDLGDLPSGEPIFYRVYFEDLDTGRARSEPVQGSLRTAQGAPRDITFLWGGDTAGQGFGIDLAWGGMRMYETMRRERPDFFVHCGDLIYADNPLPPEIKLPSGRVWRNLVTPEKSRVAETLADFRGNFAYNLLDENVRRFNAEVANYVIWDDHEIHNNWYPDQTLLDRRFTERRASVLSERARKALFEYNPIRPSPFDPKRIYRRYRHGPLLDLILLDERSYRGPNSANRQRKPGPRTAFLGPEQVQWLEQTLAESTATWKVIATDMPLGLLIGDGYHRGARWFDGWANGVGRPMGRELELADILRFIKARGIKNVVWITADVHYAAAHHYSPRRATFSDFLPFWEFVAGPLHAGTFGPNRLDPTFGPEAKYRSPAASKTLFAPSDGGQYYGLVRIAGKTAAMTVSLHDLSGKRLYQVELPPG